MNRLFPVEVGFLRDCELPPCVSLLPGFFLISWLFCLFGFWLGRLHLGACLRMVCVDHSLDSGSFFFFFLEVGLLRGLLYRPQTCNCLRGTFIPCQVFLS